MLEPSPIVEFQTGLTTSRPYYLGRSIAQQLPRYLEAHEHDKLIVVTSSHIFELLGCALVDLLVDAGLECKVLLIEEGEQNKDWAGLTRLCEQLVNIGVTRGSLVLAVGGGVISNIVGLACALLYRGVRYVDIATTLMNQSDATLSNKQAINGRRGKNHFGTYYAPTFVWSDVEYCLYEPDRQIRAAIVEAVKNGLVNDANWLDRLEARLQLGRPGIYANFLPFVQDIIQSKLDILARDPTEQGFAVVLEYGHTIGHALEFSCEGELLHGEAVSVGMCVAARLAVTLGLLDASALARHRVLLGELLGMPVDIPAGVSSQHLLDIMRADNKRTGSGQGFLLLDRVGHVHGEDGRLLIPVDERLVSEVIEQCTAAAPSVGQELDACHS